MTMKMKKKMRLGDVSDVGDVGGLLVLERR